MLRYFWNAFITIHYLYNSKIYVLYRFDLVNMFPSTDEKSGLQTVKNPLKATEKQFRLNLCVMEALKALLPKM